MAWVAFDRAIRTVEEHDVDGPVERWRAIREEIHDQVCDQGFDANVGSFTQYYGSDQLDASLLMIPLVGFLPATDPRVRGTIEAIERELVEGDFVLRYRCVDSGEVDGLAGNEGAFLACSFWLADCLEMLGRDHDARRLLDRLLDLRNDLGLLSEEYDPVAGRLVGNFPQAFSHVSLVNSAAKATGHGKPSVDHVFRGLARQVMTHARPTSPARRHMSMVSAGPMLRDLVGQSGVRPPSDPVVTSGSRPTRKQSVQREVPRKVAVKKAAPAKKAIPTMEAAERVESARKTAKKTAQSTHDAPKSGKKAAPTKKRR
jgi:glycosyl hydrolase family 15